LPAQKGFVGVVIDTLTGAPVYTDMVMGEDVAGLPVTQEALEVIVQVTTSPFEGA